MTNLHERMLPDVRNEPATVRIPGGRGSDRATAPGYAKVKSFITKRIKTTEIWNSTKVWQLILGARDLSFLPAVGVLISGVFIFT